MNQRNLVLVGTKKGAFVFESRDGRRTWKSSGPHFKGTEVFHVVYDQRNKAMFAAVESWVWGPTVAKSTDMGKTWKESKKAAKFPKTDKATVSKVWHIQPGLEDEPNVMYCGTAPAALFKSNDAGETWWPNKALLSHPARPKWQAGAGGLCLHSILVDPRDRKSMLIAISAVGVMKTTDGGKTWGFRNKNVIADFLPKGHQFPEFGQCAHHIVSNPAKPNVVYQQNHCGVYRTDNRGESWIDISKGLPSRFGFSIAVDYNNPKRVYVGPEESGDARLPPAGRFLIWASDDSGRHWEPMSSGLPKHSWYAVLREGMSSDEEDPCGIYFGTTTGQLYGSRNAGKHWELIADGLPPIYSVSTG